MSKIQWTDETWQVTHGCQKVATGCANCYAIRDAHRMAGHPNPAISGPRQGLTRAIAGVDGKQHIDWTGVVRTAPENLATPLHWKRPRKIFVNSNSDLFHPDVPFEYIAAVYGVMAACPHHTFQVLTKRPERMLEFFAWARSERPGTPKMNMAYEWDALEETAEAEEWPESFFDGLDAAFVDQPLPNVWHGVSIAEQKDADRNIPLLLQVPSAVRFVSAEPLIGPVDLTDVTPDRARNEQQPTEIIDALDGWSHQPDDSFPLNPKLGWVIVGGESGPNARPCDVAWIRSIVEQCKAAGVPVFVKQLGSDAVFDKADVMAELAGVRLPKGEKMLSLRLSDRKGGDPKEWPEDLRVREFPEVARGS